VVLYYSHFHSEVALDLVDFVEVDYRFFFGHGFVHLYKIDECDPVGYIGHTIIRRHVYPTQPVVEALVVDSGSLMTFDP